MKTILIILVAIAIVGFIALLWAFNSKSKVYAFSTEYNGTPFLMEVYNQNQYSHSYHFLQLTYGKLPPIKITTQDITGSGFPWRADLYQSAPYFQWDTIRQPVPYDYNSSFADNVCWPYFIYLDPQHYTREAFDSIGKYLSENIKELEAQLYKDFIRPAHHLNYPQLVGIVYGRRKDFVWEYKKDNLICYLQPDKRVEIKKVSDSDNIEAVGFIRSENKIQLRKNDMAALAPITIGDFVNTKTNHKLTDDFIIDISENLD